MKKSTEMLLAVNAVANAKKMLERDLQSRSLPPRGLLGAARYRRWLQVPWETLELIEGLHSDAATKGGRE